VPTGYGRGFTISVKGLGENLWPKRRREYKEEITKCGVNKKLELLFCKVSSASAKKHRRKKRENEKKIKCWGVGTKTLLEST